MCNNFTSLDGNWLSKSARTQIPSEKKDLSWNKSPLGQYVRANHSHRGPYVTAAASWWALIKITSDKFTSVYLLGWRDGFSPKSTMMS